MPPKETPGVGNWEQVQAEDDLWGEEMGRRLASAFQERDASRQLRQAERDELRASLLALKEPLTQSVGDAERESFQKAVEEKIRSIPEEPPEGDYHGPIVARDLPTARSCVSSFGPYNQWQIVWGETVIGSLYPSELMRPHVLPVDTSTPRVMHPRLVNVANADGHVTNGSGCWFSVARSGVARLEADFSFNAHNYVFGGLGYAEGSIKFGGAVWGARENRWVDRGGVVNSSPPLAIVGGEADFSEARYISFAHYSQGDDGFVHLTINFDAVAGNPYYCAGRIDLDAFALGLGAAASVEVAAVMNPLTVCI